MCNAYKHPSDCDCGFGPPYADVQVEIRSLASQKDRNPSQIADLRLRFPLPRANFYQDITGKGKTEVMGSLQSALQRVADDRLGKDSVRVKVNEVRKGSITFGVLLVMGLVGAYKFFKDYDDLSKGVKAFCRDIQRSSKWLRKLVYDTYHRVEARSHKKASTRTVTESSKRRHGSKSRRPGVHP